MSATMSRDLPIGLTATTRRAERRARLDPDDALGSDKPTQTHTNPQG
jgi:hypothetical protein